MAGQNSFDGADAFKVLDAAFEQATKRHPDSLHESFYTFGGRSVRMRIVGRELAKHIARPFSHLETHRGVGVVPQLTIDLWDENETSIRCQVRSAGNDRPWTEATAISPDGRFLGQQLPNTLTCLDLDLERIVGSMAWSERVFIYERAKPLARPLLEWHNHGDVQMIHAGLVSRDGVGVLFAGQSGSGKSTSALACLRAGFDYLGEDYVGLQRLQDGSLVGHSLYNSVFLETDDLVRFPGLIPYAIKGRPPHEEKSAVLLSQVFPDRLERVVPIRALAFPSVGDGAETRVRPASKRDALVTLALSSLLRMPSPGISGFDKLAQLVEQAPCYRLELGRDLQTIPHSVEEILAEAAP